jgi:hypothetical protein
MGGRPEPPTGLLASLKWGGYEKSFNQWEESRASAGKLHDQARRTHENLTTQARDSALDVWARRIIERIEPDLTRRVEAYRAEEWARQRERQRQEQAQAALAEEFEGIAAFRALKTRGYEDGGRQWQATPKLLREIIDLYNSHPKDKQERALSAWVRDPEKSRDIETMIEQHRENTRDRGMSR